jgi:hypothetical protein
MLEFIRPFGFLIVLIMIPTGILAFLLERPMTFMMDLIQAAFGVRGFG